MRSKRNPTRFSYSTGASRIFSGSTDIYLTGGRYKTIIGSVKKRFNRRKSYSEKYRCGRLRNMNRVLEKDRIIAIHGDLVDCIDDLQ